ncbi:uncharacterized protein MYCFIDRAFT_175556 [Pseudocercospora fijiensis CIRAD86]|uniref:Uncharacterized protein n=1 Tax=Pseudocercospora fijiensis (strain CIRAD86) TaxID=383855 RepID=M2ZSJ6_PSEFD|nr:uncharacterized protein MYCFIDRAFT_175556 [Pseudocercospora fijiensis CIRAD86]EME81989.1 hypothetical protein MYCFIDRAFT_175556 [Pseudocercospora fijiensis CIRAD86]
MPSVYAVGLRRRSGRRYGRQDKFPVLQGVREIYEHIQGRIKYSRWPAVDERIGFEF